MSTANIEPAILPETGLLTIEKLVFCLDQAHVEQFKSHLRHTDSLLPLKLIESIEQKLNGNDKIDICEAVYGKNDKKTKQTFNQLASYTFKLSGYLSQNYPNYLLQNIDRIQNLVNKGELDAANYIAEIVLDIAERIEDFHVQIMLLNFKVQQSYLFKDNTKGVKMHRQMMDVLEKEKVFHELYFMLRTNFNITRENKLPPEEVDKYLAKFREYFEHPSLKLRMISKFATFYALYYFKAGEFVSATTTEDLALFNKDLNTYSYVVFPFLFDMQSNIGFLRLNSMAVDLNTTEGGREYTKLREHYNQMLFWKNFVNIPEIFTITVKASAYLSKYHYTIYRKDEKLMDDKDANEIRSLIERCRTILDQKKVWTKNHVSDLINLKLTYSALSLLGTKEETKNSTEELESVLFQYQQINFAASMDSIFVCLMMGYFAQQQYQKCVESYSRYTNTTRGKVMYEDNDLNIHIYYYVSQWLLTRRPQYAKKLKGCLDKAVGNPFLKNGEDTVRDLAAYYKIEI